MKNLKYLNGVLTVIAVCLVLLTMSAIGIIPKANATATPHGLATVPVNADGSINVHLQDNIVKVDLVECNGTRFYTSNPFDYEPGTYPIPVTIVKN